MIGPTAGRRALRPMEGLARTGRTHRGRARANIGALWRGVRAAEGARLEIA